MRNLAILKPLFVVIAGLAFLASAAGVLFPRMYDPVVPASIQPGIFTQDLVVAIGSLVAMALAAGLGPRDVRKAVTILGILGFFFYAFGIYGIEQVYTPLHVVYLAVWAASFYALAYGLVSLDGDEIARWELPSWLRRGAAGYGILVAVVFNVLWIGQLIPLIRSADRIEYLFSVYVIDLVFIMPAFAIAAVLALRRRWLGVVGIPALFVLGVGILSPLALAEWLKPVRYGMPTDAGGLALFGGLAASFLAFTGIYFAAWRPVADRHRSGRTVELRGS